MVAEIRWGMIEIHIVMNVPISFYDPTTILQEQTMTRQELVHMPEKRLFFQRILKCQIFSQGQRLGCDLRQKWQERLDLR